jgi:hypothetical protein
MRGRVLACQSNAGRDYRSVLRNLMRTGRRVSQVEQWTPYRVGSGGKCSSSGAVCMMLLNSACAITRARRGTKVPTKDQDGWHSELTCYDGAFRSSWHDGS